MNPEDDLHEGKPFSVTAIYREEIASAKMTLEAADSPKDLIIIWEEIVTGADLAMTVMKFALNYCNTHPVTMPPGSNLEDMDDMIASILRDKIRQFLGVTYHEVSLRKDMPTG